MKKVVAFFLIFGLFPLLMFSARIKPEKKIYTTQRINPAPPAIDGVLDDQVWQKLDWAGEFIQREPYEGKEPSQNTGFKILYDDKYIYVAIFAYDTEPDRIEKRMSRRDTIGGDFVQVYIDSYFDKRTAFGFGVNAAGVKRDLVISSDGSTRDPNWDPIWLVKTSRDENGWSAEMRIPFSQLRFANSENNVWGLQITRSLFRREERSDWQFIPKDAPGFVSQFGELHGLSEIKPSRQIELIPYTVGKHQTFQPEMGNPFATGNLTDFYAGLDGKFGLTSDLTMNLTVNPDFGQVEADPSVVNLTAYETYYEEKRPFFIEGRNLLSFPLMIGDGEFSSDNLFYTRRIGGTPHRARYAGYNEFVSIPEYTSILGAFKLTGKTRSGISIGVVDSLTAPEYARISFQDQIHEEPVEPLTNYFGLKLQKDYNQGKTVLGTMMTATHRNLNDPNLDFLHNAAYTGGIDLLHTWKDRTFQLVARTMFSYVQGSKEAILQTQQSPLRYYQRPDATHVTLDPNRTSLFGHGGTVYAAKFGSGHFNYMAGVSWRSPGLELNDMGYLRQADNILQWTWASYRIWDPFFVFREINIHFNQWRGWDFSGTNIFDGGNTNFNFQFKNYWRLGLSFNLSGESLSAGALRGGPSLRAPGGWNLWYNINSDTRKKIQLNFGGSQYFGNDNHARIQDYNVGLTYIPNSAFSIMIRPSYSFSQRNLQYVNTTSMNDDPRYIMGHIDQKTLAVTLRLNLSITPDLSIQFYGQPFVSSGDYTAFKNIIQPRADIYVDRFHIYGESEISYDSETNYYHIDETQDGQVDYTFRNPNFNFLQFRSNLVVRWEYVPGSTLFLVWSQGRTGYDPLGQFDTKDNMQQLFDLPPHNVFLVKFSYNFQL